MRIYILLWVLLLVIFSSLVVASPLEDLKKDIVSIWAFENNLVDTENQSLNNMTDNGVAYTTDAKIGSAAVFDSGGFVNISAEFAELQNFSWSFWVKANTTNRYVISQGRNDATPYVGNHFIYSDRQFNWFAGNTVAPGFWNVQDITSQVDNQETWHLYTITVDIASRNLTTYVDDGSAANTTYNLIDSGILRYGNSTYNYRNLYLFKDCCGVNVQTGQMDELIYFNRTITLGEHLLLWNNSYGINISSSESAGSMLITLITPSNDTKSNSALNNFTYNVTNTTGNPNVLVTGCSLYSNITGSWEQTAQNETVVAINDTNNFTNVNVPDGFFIWNVNCTSNNYWGVNHTLTVDTVSPILSTNFTNTTVKLSFNLTGQFNFSDANLIHTVNITIPTANYRIVDITNISQSLYVYNLSHNITNISTGTHILSVRYADGGTDKNLKWDYDFSNGLFNDYSRYDFPDGGYIKTTSKTASILDRWSSIKQPDRYIQVYEPNSPSDTITFIEESDMPIFILNNPGHHGDTWIVMGNHWKDYVLEGEDSKVSIKRINKYKVEVTVSNILKNQEVLTFKSVGDLNVVIQNYTFGKTNGTIIYDESVSDFEEQTITFSIEITGGVTSTEAALFYNGTQQTTVKVSGTSDVYSSTFDTPFINTTEINSTNMSISWIYNITGPVDVESGNLTVLQEVSSSLIDNCSTFTTGAINFTTRRDDTEALVISDLTGFFQISVEGSDELKDFNLTWGRNETHGICIFPQTAIYNVFAQFEFENNSFSKKTYYFYNNNLTNVTNNITLYFSPNTTFVTFTVTDQNDDYVDNLYINVLKYDLTTDSHVVSEVLRTDEQGQAIGNIVLDTQWYKFLLVLDNNVVLETEPVKITSTSRNFRVNLLGDFYDTYDLFNGVLVSLEFTNSTKNFAYTFINPTGDSVEGCLEVVEKSFTEDVVINQSCQTTSAATILVNIGSDTEVANKSYIAKGTIQTDVNDADTRFLAATLGVGFNELFKVWGTSGLWLMFFVRVALIMMGMWAPVVAIGLMLIGDIALYWAGIFNMGPFVITTYIILALITMWKVGRR